MINNTPSILVLGASGGLGQYICREVLRQFGADALIVGDYKPERGEQTASGLGTATSAALSTGTSAALSTGVSFIQADINNPDSLRAALRERVTAVIVAVAQQTPYAQIACIEAGIPCLDVTVQPQFIAQVKGLDAQAKAADVSSLILTGLYPGIAGVMAKEAAAALDEVDTLDVSLCQNSQSSAGATGVADMLGLFAQPVMYRANGRSEIMRGFMKKRPFQYPPPIGIKNHRLVNFIEAEAVSGALAIPNVNFWTGYDKASFDQILSVLNRLKILTLFNRPRWRTKLANLIAGGMSEAEDETCAIVAEAVGWKDGQTQVARVSILAGSDYGATALGVVAMAKLLLNGNVVAPGVHHPTQIFSLKPLLAAMGSDDVQLFETAVCTEIERELFIVS